jgi:type 1 glutamine amidotransferase
MINSFLKLCLILAILSLTGVACSKSGNTSGKKPIKVLMVGGGSSHDFNRWYKEEDSQTLKRDGLATVEYTDDPATILSKIAGVDVLYLANNQPIKDDATRKAIFALVETGKGLVLAHPALWYNWKDWPEYNQKLVGGGSKGHNKYGPFDVTVTNKNSPIMKGVPPTFHLDDELYYYKPDAAGTPIEVLATAKATTSPNVFPSIFTVKYPKGRVVGIALGHDAASHTIEPYQTILRNSVKWAAGH